MSAWPNPDKSGFPQNPERDGWHWLLSPEEKEPGPYRWTAGGEDIVGAYQPMWWGTKWSLPELLAKDGYCYLGPCLTPADHAASVAAAADEARDQAADLIIEGLARILGVNEFTPCDGTETWDGDVLGTAHRVLVAGGVINDEDGALATHAGIAAAAEGMRREIITQLALYAGFEEGCGEFELIRGIDIPSADALARRDAEKAREGADVERDACRQIAWKRALLPGDCEHLGPTDPETGVCECRIELKDDVCPCWERADEAQKIADAISARADRVLT